MPPSYRLTLARVGDGMATFESDAEGKNLVVCCHSRMADGYVSEAWAAVGADGGALVAYQLDADVTAYVAKKPRLDRPLSNTVSFRTPSSTS